MSAADKCSGSHAANVAVTLAACWPHPHLYCLMVHGRGALVTAWLLLLTEPVSVAVGNCSLFSWVSSPVVAGGIVCVL